MIAHVFGAGNIMGWQGHPPVRSIDFYPILDLTEFRKEEV